MDSPTEMEPSLGHKIASFVRHRGLQRKAERALRSTPLEEALEKGTAALQDDKDKHEKAAAILRGDLKSE